MVKHINTQKFHGNILRLKILYIGTHNYNLVSFVPLLEVSFMHNQTNLRLQIIHRRIQGGWASPFCGENLVSYIGNHRNITGAGLP